jgi:selenocysteine lyase/cysteine desulfurase
VTKLPISLIGDGMPVACVDGVERPYVSFDAAASTGALGPVLERVERFLPTYSSVHRGAGRKSQLATEAYEGARAAALGFAGREGRDDIAIICRNTTEAINHLAYRMQFAPGDTVLTTVVEHHANLLPWSRLARCRHVECGPEGTFSAADVAVELERSPRPRLLAITAASNITGWMPPIDEILEMAHACDVPVAVDGAQLAPHRALPAEADFVAWSGHKMYAPFGAGVLVGPRESFTSGDPFLAGGGAVDLVELDDVLWTAPPEREEAGSPNVVGAVALHAAMDTLGELGWPAIVAHDRDNARSLREGLAGIPGVRLLGPDLGTDTLPVATFVVEGVPHALVAARLSAEDGIGVRHGCFCAHPYLMRLLGLSEAEVSEARKEIRRGDRSRTPGAVRASAGVNTTQADIGRLIEAVSRIASGIGPPVAYFQDSRTGDFFPDPELAMWYEEARAGGSSCSPG